MAMEHVLVVYPTDRLVYIDDEKCGYTNCILHVDAGTHTFTLGPYSNYTPESQEIIVEDTTMLEPLVIIFSKQDDA